MGVRHRKLSDLLATELHDFAVGERFVYTHRWRVGDLIVWDNRCTMHRALPFDEDRHRRLMHRVTIRGTPPWGDSRPEPPAEEPR